MTEGVNTDKNEEYYTDIARHIEERLDMKKPINMFHLACALYCSPSETNKQKCEKLGI